MKTSLFHHLLFSLLLILPSPGLLAQDLNISPDSIWQSVLELDKDTSLKLLLGENAPDFSVEDKEGRIISLNQLLYRS